MKSPNMILHDITNEKKQLTLQNPYLPALQLNFWPITLAFPLQKCWTRVEDLVLTLGENVKDAKYCISRCRKKL